MTCIFVYGLINMADSPDGGAALRRELARVTGVSPAEPPGLVEVSPLGALVSMVSLDDFSEPEFEARMEDITWLEPRVRAHAAVIMRAFECQPVLPMRFGTLFSSTERMAAHLRERLSELLPLLEATRGLEEWTVRICANPEALVERRPMS